MLPLLIGAGVGMLKGAMDAKAQREAQANNMQANAAALQYSPWTKMNPGMMAGGADPALSNMFEGAVGGAMQGSQFMGGAAAPAAAAMPKATSPWSGMNQNYFKKQNLYNAQPGQTSGFMLS
jgi:hypothetical protein